MAKTDDRKIGGALDELLAMAARDLPRRAADDADGQRCDRWRTQPDRERTLWDLIDGALDEQTERGESEHLQRCGICLAAVQRILQGIEAAAQQPRWSAQQIQRLLVRHGAVAPSPTQEALEAVRDLVVRLKEKGLALLAGTGDLVPATARVRGAPAEAAEETVLQIRWDRSWGGLQVSVEQTAADACDLLFTANPGPGVPAGDLRLDWSTADGRLLESVYFEKNRASVSDVGAGHYVIVLTAGEREIDRLVFEVAG